MAPAGAGNLGADAGAALSVSEIRTGMRVEVGFKGTWSPGTLTATTGDGGSQSRRGIESSSSSSLPSPSSSSASSEVTYSVMLDDIGLVEEVPLNQLRRGSYDESLEGAPHSPNGSMDPSEATTIDGSQNGGSTNTSVSSTGSTFSAAGSNFWSGFSTFFSSGAQPQRKL